jgi:hypothetical protein
MQTAVAIFKTPFHSPVVFLFENIAVHLRQYNRESEGVEGRNRRAEGGQGVARGQEEGDREIIGCRLLE